MAPWAAIIFLVMLSAASVVSTARESDFGEISTLRVLDDKSFEHDTQAATGQTAGVWLVLFTGAECPTCKDAEASTIQIASHLGGEQLVVAKVDLSDCPTTAKRFNLKSIPSLILFRDRHMFTYGGKWSAVGIIDFIEDGWMSVPREVVPAEIHLGGELQAKALEMGRTVLKWLGNRPGIVACLGAISATLGYVYTKQFLNKKRKPKRPRGRPRKRAD